MDMFLILLFNLILISIPLVGLFLIDDYYLKGKDKDSIENTKTKGLKLHIMG